MDKRPIRRKFRDNPYRLESLVKDNIYIIKFHDSRGIPQAINVKKEIFDIFDENERYENVRYKEYFNHILHGEFIDEIISDGYMLEDFVMKKLDFEELRNIINDLPIIQKNRIYKYFYQNKTLKQISKEENCSIRAVKYSIDIGLKKISKKIEK